MEQLLWTMFEKSGNISSYLFFRALEEEDEGDEEDISYNDEQGVDELSMLKSEA